MFGGGRQSVPMGRDDAARNLIVNYIPSNYDETQLRNLFSQQGQVEKVKLITDQQTGASKGYGFVTFVNQASASRAMRELSGAELGGKKLRVAYAQPALVTGGPSPSINVFFSGFGNLFNENAIKDLAGKYGEVLEVKVLDPVRHPRGVAFARFVNINQAETCVRNLNGVDLNTPAGPVTLSVKFAERKQAKKAQNNQRGGGMGYMQQHNPMMQFPFGNQGGMQDMGGAGGPTVFVHGLQGATESDILQAVHSLFVHANIVKVDVPKHATGEPRNFCFVHFADFASAQAALAFDGQVFGSRPLQVRFK